MFKNLLKIKYLILLSSFLMVFVVNFGCGKKESDRVADSPSLEMEESQKSISFNESPKEMKKTEQPMKKDQADDKMGLDSNFIAPMEEANSRLLEYAVTLNYETGNFLKSRRELLKIVSKYGFIKNSSSSTGYNKPYSNSNFYVKSDKLYNALLECDRIGILLHEDINVIDHTEFMVLNKRKAVREQLRIERKNKVIGQVSPSNKRWIERENSLERSEDAIDDAKHQQWKINDKVKWASITISLKGPDLPDRIEIPVYKNAIVGMINIFLNILYGIIWLIPFVLVAGGIAFLFRKLYNKHFGS